MSRRSCASRAASSLLLFGVAVTLLVGCTSTPTVTSAPSSSATTPVTTSSGASSAVSAAQVFSSQSKVLDEKLPTAQAVLTKEGSGSGTIDVPALPAGKSRIGLVINCTEGADWKAVISQKTAADAGAPCSEGAIPLADFAIDSPKEVAKLKLTLLGSTKYWLTVYYV